MWWGTRNALALFLQEIPACIHTCWCLTTNRTPSNLFTPSVQKMPSQRKGQEPITSFDNNDPQPCSPTLLLPTSPPPHSSTLSESIHLSSLSPGTQSYATEFQNRLILVVGTWTWLSAKWFGWVTWHPEKNRKQQKKKNWLFITFLFKSFTSTHLLYSNFSMSSVVPSFFSSHFWLLMRTLRFSWPSHRLAVAEWVWRTLAPFLSGWLFSWHCSLSLHPFLRPK